MLVPSRTFVSTVLLTSEGYDTKPVAELKGLLRQRGLATSGRKAELIARLKQSDMTRAGSSLTADLSTRAKSTAAKAPKASKAPKPPKTPKTPTDDKVPFEAGTVMSASSSAQGEIGKASPDQAHEAVSSAPGVFVDDAARDAQQADAEHTDMFVVHVPFEEPAAPEPQYIPTIQAFVDPTRDFSDSYTPVWYTPRVVTVSDDKDVSDPLAAPTDPPHSQGLDAFLSFTKDMLPKELQKQVAARLSTAEVTTVPALRELLTDLIGSLPMDTSVHVSPSNARPSARRALREEERRGLWVLGALLATGLAVGGVVNAASASSAPHPADAPVETPRFQPHYLHGGGVVGGGQRKV